jgi:hypothetical protein
VDESALRTLLENLERSQSSLHGWLEFWTTLVIVGVALEIIFVVWEYREDLHDFRRGIVHPPEKPITLRFVLGLFASVLIVVGVGGELYAGAKLERVETRIRGANDELYLLLSREAGDAKTSAEIAHGEVDAIRKEADAIENRLREASTQLGALEEDLIAQGPRWRLLEKAAPELIKQLTPFAGQNVDLFVCGTRESASGDREMMSTWGRIADILGDKGAKWSELHGGLSFWDTRPFACEGMLVSVSSRAPKTTMDAAKALSDGLARTLPPSIDKMLGIADPDWTISVIQRGLEAENAPWALIAKHPDLITVFIQTHSQTAPSKTKKHK